jgi:hypothetical protein
MTREAAISAFHHNLAPAGGWAHCRGICKACKETRHFTWYGTWRCLHCGEFNTHQRERREHERTTQSVPAEATLTPTREGEDDEGGE